MPPARLHCCTGHQDPSVTHRPQRTWTGSPDGTVFRRLWKKAIQSTRAPHRNHGGRERQAVWIPELCFGIDVQEEEGDRSPWSWDGNYRGLGVLGWAQRAEAWPGEPRALPPPQECRKEARQLGPDLRLCPLLVSLARHSSILSVPAVCHPPLGEAAAEDAFLGTLAGHVVHPNSPCACGDKWTRCLSRHAGAQDRRALPVNTVCPESCLNSPVEWTPCLRHATETNMSSLGAVS